MKEKLKLVLEALLHAYHEDEAHPKTLEAITAIKEYMAQPEQERCEYCKRGLKTMCLCGMKAQPEQEPVAWKETDEVECPVCNDKGFPWPKCGHITYLERTPPQRTWVGLTPQERDEINEQVYGAVPHHVAFHAAIEAKLKELNT